MRKVLLGVAALAVIAGVGGVSYWAGSRGAAKTGPQAGAAPKAAGAAPGVAVEATKVSVMKLPHALAAVGSLRSDETVVVRPEIVGRVAQIQFREGERVAKGQILIRLDDSVQQADLDRAKANLTLSKTKHERALDLLNKGFLSSQAKDEAENNLKVAQADVELARARVAKTALLAPFNGTLGLRQVSVGEYVKEGQDLVNLEAIDVLKVDFRIPEIYMSQVKDGQSLQITLDALPGKTYEGRVYAINPLLDANGRAIVIRAQVPNRDGKLRPGMFARVRLFTTESRDAIVVPEESLFPQGDDKYVYKVVDGKAQRQKVEIGQRREGKVEIVAGLAANDVVVTAGQLKIRDGSSVTVAGAAPAAPQAAPVGKADTGAMKVKGS